MTGVLRDESGLAAALGAPEGEGAAPLRRVLRDARAAARTVARGGESTLPREGTPSAHGQPVERFQHTGGVYQRTPTLGQQQPSLLSSGDLAGAGGGLAPVVACWDLAFLRMQAVQREHVLRGWE